MPEARDAHLHEMVRSAACPKAVSAGGYDGVQTTGLQVLLAVAAVGDSGCTIGDAAHRLGLSASTARAALEPLRAREFVTQVGDPKDGRRVIVFVTHRGSALLDAFVNDRMADPSVAELMSAAGARS